MKRVIMSAAALAIGGFVFAQTPQTIAPIVQQSSPTAAATIGGNYSDIDQKGIGSDAKVQQQGTANASFIEQTGTDVANRNSVDVLQWGNVQPSISGHLNYSDIKQDGAGNDFMATQQGDENEILGLQNGLDNAALVQQGATSPQQAQNNLAKVDQDGKDNYAEVQQRYDDNEASILQRNDAVAGVGNRSYQDQRSNPNQSAGQVAIGEQWGDNNEAVQIQDSGSPALGGGNHAEIQQGDATTEATGAFAQQVQSGATNEAYATQYLSSDESYQEQLGTDNKAVVEQNTGGISSGGNNLVEQFQDGDRNEARSDQNGNGNTVNQEQYGQDNFSSVKQRYGQDAGNMATSIQDGSLNNSVINQQSHGNMSMVDQTGDGQTSLINQNNPTTGAAAAAGGYNTATVIQRNANVALTPQTRRIAASKRHTF
ncbi:hypothetical protein IL45_05215 [Nonlabens ulvanivorans]|uniref:Curlin associated repeat-containing protein n=1 Tax=Nonlabens ulvanivorans TaxID=906888 RepID=A0A084JXC2_NONUL|nr:hypothetical protein [Nonlabens ulvanivorans]KEZ93606.1 hypothetical protein IL45_05215 [Nonlabens ulvanivorans]